MPVITNPTNALIAATSSVKDVSGELLLQPGTIVDAQVLAARANLVKIVITGIAIEVLSEVPLQPGTALKLAVLQTADGIRLAVVDKMLPDQAERMSLPSASATAANVNLTTTVRVAAPSIQPAQAPAQSLEPSIAVQATVVSLAARAAAPVQAGMASLFASLPVVVASAAAPPDVKAAAANLLVARPNLTADLSGTDVRTAFKSSGLLLEAELAKGAMPAGAPDLKAALTVFRQLLSNWAATGEGQFTGAHQPSPVDVSAAAAMKSLVATLVVKAGDLPMSDETARVAAPVQASPAGGPEAVRADRLQGKTAVSGNPEGVPLALQKLAPGESERIASTSLIPDQSEIAKAIAPASAHFVSRALKDQAPDVTKLLSQTGESDTADASVKPLPAPPLLTPRAAAEPAPPFRGSTPSVQPIALPTIAAEMPTSHMVARLLDQTDSALARQTLLQVASLPEKFDAGSVSQPQQRWAFEIPFATPQGTAVAQFEIADEGDRLSEVEAPKRIWRARFTLDIERTGPVHALVSLVGEKTTVRMWAERPDTAAKLHDNMQALDGAMREANLKPGDIVVQSGQPPQPKIARAGYFLDRAT